MLQTAVLILFGIHSTKNNNSNNNNNNNNNKNNINYINNNDNNNLGRNVTDGSFDIVRNPLNKE